MPLPETPVSWVSLWDIGVLSLVGNSNNESCARPSLASYRIASAQSRGSWSASQFSQLEGTIQWRGRYQWSTVCGTRECSFWGSSWCLWPTFQAPSSPIHTSCHFDLSSLRSISESRFLCGSSTKFRSLGTKKRIFLSGLSLHDHTLCCVSFWGGFN